MERVAGQAVAGREPVAGGYTHADRSVVTLADGRRLYVKRATDELTADWLRAEHRVYTALAGAPFLAELVDFVDDGRETALVLEDLGGAHWPPPWRPGDIDAVIGTLEAVAATPPPRGLGHAPDLMHLDLWPDVAADPEPFLRLGFCSARWLDEALPDLLAASKACDLGGDTLVHFDVRSDNLCRRPDGTVVVIDWNMACVGSPRIDIGCWLPSVQAEGGPPPEEIAGDRYTEEAVAVAGYFARNAGLPILPHAPKVRQIQLVQLRTALPWAVRRLGLPPLDGPAAALAP